MGFQESLLTKAKLARLLPKQKAIEGRQKQF
jgi:hypothetical protein